MNAYDAMNWTITAIAFALMAVLSAILGVNPENTMFTYNSFVLAAVAVVLTAVPFVTNKIRTGKFLG